MLSHIGYFVNDIICLVSRFKERLVVSKINKIKCSSIKIKGKEHDVGTIIMFKSVLLFMPVSVKIKIPVIPDPLGPASVSSVLMLVPASGPGPGSSSLSSVTGLSRLNTGSFISLRLDSRL